MNRRELLQRASVLVSGSILGVDSLLAKNINWDNMEAELSAKGIGLFSKKQVQLLNEVADTIIPTTDTPGAKDAKTGQFIAVIVSDCYEPADQKRFLDGLTSLENDCKAKTGKSFMKCTAQERQSFLSELDTAQKAYHKSKKKEDPAHYFRTMKDLTLWGYFTSEIGATQALRFVEYPGKYTTIDYKKGDRNFGGY